MRGSIYTKPYQMRGIERFREFFLFENLINGLNGKLLSYVISCGKCEAHQPTKSTRLSSSRLDMERIGWRHTSRDGWVCPDCAKKIEVG